MTTSDAAPHSGFASPVLGISSGVGAGSLAMIALIAVGGWLDLSESAWDFVEWAILAMGCAVTGVVATALARRLGASDRSASLTGVLAVTVLLLIVAVLVVALVVLADQALDGF